MIIGNTNETLQSLIYREGLIAIKQKYSREKLKNIFNVETQEGKKNFERMIVRLNDIS